MVFQAGRFDGGRSKKLIAALLLSVDKATSFCFDCFRCTDEDKKNWGCTRPLNKEDLPDGVWKISFCLACNGKDDNCQFCEGSNITKVWRCPRAIATPEYQMLLPFFFDYHRSISGWGGGQTAWPDGAGRLFQPTKLVQAFNIMGRLMMDYDHKGGD